MQSYKYVGKNLEELKQQALEELNVPENSLIFNSTEKKGSLFKGNSITLEVYKITDIAEEIKNYLNEILQSMTIEATYETKIRDNQIIIKMYSNKNNILIGRNGATLKALQTLIRAYIFQKINTYPYILLDVENYKEKQQRNLEHLAKQIAREVSKTKQPVIMDNMNSFERRIVHNVISKFNNVTTISEGTEPNRHIIVKPKED